MSDTDILAEAREIGREKGRNVPPRIYLAGPDVFLPDAVAMGEAKKRLCAARGLAGAFPLDNALDLSGLSPKDAGLLISKKNEELMRSCDAIIANVCQQMEEDRIIWRHKRYFEKPLLCDGDGPFGKFRKWYSQFLIE